MALCNNLYTNLPSPLSPSCVPSRRRSLPPLTLSQLISLSLSLFLSFSFSLAAGHPVMASTMSELSLPASPKTLSRAQHCFIQTLFTRGCVMPESDARQLARDAALLSSESSASDFERFWGELNVELGAIHLEMRRVRYPYDKTKYMGIVNKVRRSLVSCTRM